MTDDEKRLLMALAACVLADRVPGGPDRETQVKVLRQLMEPFSDFLRKDRQRMQKEKEQRRHDPRP